MGPVGWQEMVVIFVVALVLFGPKKLPELGRTLGRAITEFRRASNELKATFEREMQSLEREHESLKEVTKSYTDDIYNHYNDHYSDGTTNYDSPYSDDGAYSSESYESHASPSTVSATATQGAESTGTEPAGHQGQAVEGTIPRSAGTETAAAHADSFDEAFGAEAAPEPTHASPASGSRAGESKAG